MQNRKASLFFNCGFQEIKHFMIIRIFFCICLFFYLFSTIFSLYFHPLSLHLLVLKSYFVLFFSIFISEHYSLKESQDWALRSCTRIVYTGTDFLNELASLTLAVEGLQCGKCPSSNSCLFILGMETLNC